MAEPGICYTGSIGVSLDLFQIMLCPENVPNSINMDITFSRDSAVSPKNMKSIVCIKRPLILPLLQVSIILVVSLIVQARGSRVRVNNKGDSGHPCWVAIENKNVFDNLWFTVSLDVDDKYSECIQAIKWAPNPNLPNTRHK